MVLRHSRLSGPVKPPIPASDTVVLTRDRSLKWPALLGISSLSVLIASVWVHALRPIFLFWAVPALAASFCFVFVRADVVLSKGSSTLEVQPIFAGIRLKPKTPLLSFSEIREFLVESEFELGPTADESGNKPFVWHLTAITNNDKYYRLTWHFDRQPILLAGQEAARIAGKPLREQSDPSQSSTWSHWGYNLMR